MSEIDDEGTGFDMSNLKKKMTPAEAGRKGGQKTAATHTHDFYVEIGRQGGEAVLDKRGPSHFGSIGTKGGRSRAAHAKEGKV